MYTVAYEPTTGAMTLLWPDDQWRLSVHGDEQGERPRTVLSLLPDLSALPPAQPQVHPRHYVM